MIDTALNVLFLIALIGILIQYSYFAIIELIREYKEKQKWNNKKK